jgi:hypothetical protein
MEDSTENLRESEQLAALALKAKESESIVEKIISELIPRIMAPTGIPYECKPDLRIRRTETYEPESLVGVMMELTINQSPNREYMSKYEKNAFYLTCHKNEKVCAVILGIREGLLYYTAMLCTEAAFKAALKESMKDKDASELTASSNTPHSLVQFVLDKVKSKFFMPFKKDAFSNQTTYDLFKDMIKSISFTRFVGKDMYPSRAAQAVPAAAEAGHSPQQGSAKKRSSEREERGEDIGKASQELVSRLRAVPPPKLLAVNDQWEAYIQFLEAPSPSMLCVRLSTDTAWGLIEDVLRQTARGSCTGSELIARTLAEEQRKLLITKGELGNLSELTESLRKKELLKAFSANHHRRGLMAGFAGLIVTSYAFDAPFLLLEHAHHVDEAVNLVIKYGAPQLPKGPLEGERLNHKAFRKHLRRLVADPENAGFEAEELSEEVREDRRAAAEEAVISFAHTRLSMLFVKDKLSLDDFGYVGEFLKTTICPKATLLLNHPVIFKLMLDDLEQLKEEKLALQSQAIRTVLGNDALPAEDGEELPAPDAPSSDAYGKPFFKHGKWWPHPKLLRSTADLYKKKRR